MTSIKRSQRLVELLQRSHRRPVEWRPVSCEMRPMAGAIPAPLQRIPVQMAADVGTRRRHAMDAAIVITEGRNLAQTFADDSTMARLQFVD